MLRCGLWLSRLCVLVPLVAQFQTGLVWLVLVGSGSGFVDWMVSTEYLDAGGLPGVQSDLVLFVSSSLCLGLA